MALEFPTKKCTKLHGSVGQRFILLLAQHPHFVLHAVGASSRSAGKKYKDAHVDELVVKECKASEFADCNVVFKMEFLKGELAVFSNAKNYRRSPLAPLVVPTVNLTHFDKGFLDCNSNCAVISIVIPFAAIQKAFGSVDQVSVVTMQAISGAGYPGVSNGDKLETEAPKILGSVNAVTGFSDQSDLEILAACNRVLVLDGHMVCVSLRFKNREGLKPTAEQVKKAMRDYVSEANTLGCPQDWIEIPGNGYTVSVRRVREDESGIFDLKFVALTHNTVIGAAGSSILNAEAAVLKGYI
ncbi:aspartate semialdehyde dehydrogenase-like protein [Rhexocercosporidium sp. MPI-PUGE-AT-0058]|nr:aspartate semialdehyde dehydrogenase-like protein [Rhexocercosporidium sp. MPI-PUGE-AT-0058]